jgi:hypothetical protein
VTPNTRQASNIRWSDRGSRVFVEPRSESLIWINQLRYFERNRVSQLRR